MEVPTLNQTSKEPQVTNLLILFSIFLGEQKEEFIVGRLQECDININQNTISRRQCRFFHQQLVTINTSPRVLFEDGMWKIADGAHRKDSANGTWISLTDYRVRRERMESEPRVIDNFTEIKVSDTILRVKTLFNHPVD